MTNIRPYDARSTILSDNNIMCAINYNIVPQHNVNNIIVCQTGEQFPIRFNIVQFNNEGHLTYDYEVMKIMTITRLTNPFGKKLVRVQGMGVAFIFTLPQTFSLSVRCRRGQSRGRGSRNDGLCG